MRTDVSKAKSNRRAKVVTKGKRIVAVLLSVTMVLTSSGAVMAQESNSNLNGDSNIDVRLMADTEVEFAGGDGTEENPYQVATAEQLDAVRNDMDAYYIQVADIDLEGEEWEPIGYLPNDYYGNTSDLESAFSGTYNGNGYIISNMKISQTTDQNISVGLFAVNSGVLKNICLENININVDTTYTQLARLPRVGGIVGSQAGTLIYCSVSGYISVNGRNCGGLYVGGILGYGICSYCTNYTAIQIEDTDENKDSGEVYCGGITGHSGTVYGTISYCVNYGNITASANSVLYCGGISGEYGTIESCVNYGDVAGEIIAIHSWPGSAGNCNAGGIVGSTAAVKDSCYNCVNFGNVSATNACTRDGDFYAGGIAGNYSSYGEESISNCYNLADEIIAEDDSAGRILGHSWYAGTTGIGDCYSIDTTTVNGEVPDEADTGSTTIHGASMTESEISEAIADILTAAGASGITDYTGASVDFNLNIYRTEKLLDDTIPLGSSMSAVLSQTTPCALYVSALQDAGFESYTSAWNTLTAVFDTADNLSTLYDLAVEESDIYSAVILNVLQAATEYGLVDTYKGTIDEFSSCLSEIVTLLKLEYNIDFLCSYDFNQFTDEELETLQNVTEEVFKSQYADITLLNEIFSNIGKACDIADDIETYVEKCASIYAILEMDESMVAVVEAMYEECPSSNVYMKFALKDCVNILNSSAEEVALELLSGAATMIGVEAASVAIDFVWDIVKETALNVGFPEIEILMAGYKTGKFISNTLFQTDSTIEQYCRMLAILDVEDLLDDVYDTLLSEYQSEQDSASAAAYLSAIDVIYNARDYDCQCAYTFVDILDDTLAAKIGALFDQTEADQRGSIKSSIDSIQRSYTSSHESVLTGWISYLEEDYPDSGLYEQYYGLFEESLNRILTKKYVAACPVDVYVYDGDDNLVAYVSGGIPYCSANITVLIRDDTKTLYFYNDEEYRIEYIGTDTGTMDLTISEYDEEGNTQRDVYFYDIALSDGKTYGTDVDGLTLEDTSYYLDSDDDTTITPDLDTYQPGSESHTATLVSASMIINGELCFETTAYAGEQIRIYAYIPEGYEFAGWTSDIGESVFDNPGSQVTNLRMPDQDVTVTATLQEADTVSDPDTLLLRRGNTFYLINSGDGSTEQTFTCGESTDEVLIGDWDGDGYDTVCLRSGNTYYFSNTLGGNTEYSFSFGKSTDEVLVGDWDGDGIDTLCLRRGSTFYISNSADSGTVDYSFTLGGDTDEIISGDWDGDGIDTLSIRSGNVFYIYNTLGGEAEYSFSFGKTTDTVIVGDWDGDGTDGLCLRRGTACYISNDPQSGTIDTSFSCGKDSDEIYAGTWGEVAEQDVVPDTLGL
ncbi:MAG: hypothetical protein LUF32_08015, partial [Clostridiales bacterium]|nr:hypothetical protein [Clostridiales bacterium]